jgi:hypothetical protein
MPSKSQVNFAERLALAPGYSEMGVIDEVKKTDIYQKYVGDTVPKKVVFVPNKLINIVI